MEGARATAVSGSPPVEGGGNGTPRRLGAVMRDSERVTPLELFFDLVFVLALTQCTALMAHEPHPYGIAKGLLCSGCSGGHGSGTPG